MMFLRKSITWSALPIGEVAMKEFLKRVILVISLCMGTLCLLGQEALGQETVCNPEGTVCTTRYRVSYPNDLGLLELDSVNPCTGENLLIAGTMQLVYREVITSSGKVIGSSMFELQASAVGETSGTNYRVVFNDNSVGNIDPRSSSVSTNYFQLRLISQESTDNSLLNFVIHTTFNANGMLTAEIFRVNEKCVG
jgi:hypothetical protein